MAYITMEPPAEGTPPLPHSLIRTAVAPLATHWDGDGLSLFVPEQTQVPQGLVTLTPQPPFRFTVELDMHTPAVNAGPIGILARDSVSGKFKTFGYQNAGLVATDYAADNTINATHGIRGIAAGSHLWLSWIDDGANVAMRSSNTGRHWRTDFTISRTDWCTPDQIGVCVTANEDTSPVSVLVLNWCLD